MVGPRREAGQMAAGPWERRQAAGAEMVARVAQTGARRDSGYGDGDQASVGDKAGSGAGSGKRCGGGGESGGARIEAVAPAAVRLQKRGRVDTN